MQRKNRRTHRFAYSNTRVLYYNRKQDWLANPLPRWSISNITRDKEDFEKELEDLPEFKEREVIGFVLAPEYNTPTDSELEVKNNAGQIVYNYKPVSYKRIYDWLKDKAMETIDKDPNFKAFYNAMKKHTYVTKGESIREDMMNIFFTRIQKCPKVSSNTENNA